MMNPKIPSMQRWFIRFRYLGFFYQLKYFIKDHVIRKPYKIIRFNGEFQQELLHVIPFAYWHYKNGTLLKTESTEFTKELYFFSSNHIERKGFIRDYRDNENLEIPNAPHDRRLLKYKWKQVPYKRKFENNDIKFKKEILIIANRYNSEWGNEPISYFDLKDLEHLFSLFNQEFQIIYNRPPSNRISNDNSIIYELHDYEFIKEKYPEVLLLDDLEEKFNLSVNSYNHLQVLAYSKCNNFISIHGGTATLASAFGGINLIYSKEGHEHFLNEFENVFPELAQTKIFVFKEKEMLLKKAFQILAMKNEN